jgi:outer membrane protein OmpA-like peptidoglycan-associated protein
MKTCSKTLLFCLLFPTLLLGQKMQEKPVWQFDLYFDFAKADLKTAYHPRLDSLVVALQDSTFMVSMTAHTDSIGDAKANFALSQKRAQAVKDYLVSKNAPETRIHTEGYGETQPISENQSDDGRQLNRRVSVLVLRRLAEVKGIVTDSDGKTPLARAKVMLASKFVRDSAFTDENGVYSLTARLNLPAKMRIIPDPSNDCTLYDGQIFTVDQWVTTQNFTLKCKSKPVQIITTTKPPVVNAKKAPMKVIISGTVTNDSAQIVQHARLVFSNNNGKDTVFTDDKGHYSVSNLMYSDIHVGISANSHLPFFQGIVVDSATKRVDFKLQTIAAGKKAALKNINFYTSSAEVMTESTPSMQELLQFMKDNDKCTVEIGGHITSFSNAPYPEGSSLHFLSLSRAKTIYDFLIKNGIDANRMTYKGYSNFNMIHESPQTEVEHLANRRVEIKIISDGSK